MEKTVILTINKVGNLYNISTQHKLFAKYYKANILSSELYEIMESLSAEICNNSFKEHGECYGVLFEVG